MDSQEAGDSVLNNTNNSQPTQSSIANSQRTVNIQLTRDREERLRLLKEKQNEERLKKLEELKQQALIAQKFREQKEEERRRRIEELRLRDSDRRQQVEERKRQIWEVERDRREAILRKNQEREARIESKKKNERSSLVFAFGSSTPRMLEPADTGGTYWASRRATSTTNVMSISLCAPAPGPLTRRSSERELSDSNKKRATSAGGLLDYRKQDGEDFNTVQPFRTAYRRKTDLMPTIPSSSSSRDARNAPGTKSGDTTPSRPTSSMSQTSSATSVRTRPQVMPRRPRPASIAITGVSSPTDSTSSRQSISSEFRNTKSTEKPPLPKVHVTKKPMQQPKQSLDTQKKASAKSSKQSSVCSTPALLSPSSESAAHEIVIQENDEDNKTSEETEPVKIIELDKISVSQSEILETKESIVKENSKPSNIAEPIPPTPTPLVIECNDASEEEAKAKAALAERRRLARIQAEKEAEEERLRQENLRLAEIEALKREEEEQRKLEEESLRLIEEAKRAEEQRLLQAIQEVQLREEEERKRKEEDLRQKLEKEELERKAKEEAEKQRIEMEIRLKKEEEDRQARRKRVELIMLRTRGKGSNSTNASNKEDGENLVDNSSSPNDSFLNDATKENEPSTPPPSFSHTNGHHNGFSDKNNEQNVVSNTMIDLNSHDDKAVDLLNLGIPTILSNENNVNNVNYTNSQVTDLLS